jgi:hypothetical protein
VLTRFYKIAGNNIIGIDYTEFTNFMANEKRSDMLTLIRARACKRCGGDLSLECDTYGVYIQCIQCGANWTKEDLAQTTARDAEKSLKAEKVKTPTTTGPRT